MRRWGWEFLYAPDGLNQIKERVDAFEKRRFHALLDAARSWRESENVAEHAGADRLTDEAIRLGIEPTLTAEEGEREFKPRHDDWWMSPALGEGIPQVSLEAHRELGSAIDEVAGAFSQEVSLAQIRAYHDSNRRTEEPRSVAEPPPCSPGTEDDEVKAIPSTNQIGGETKKFGRPRETNVSEDRRIAEAWETGRYKRHEELGHELGKSKLYVRQALDRHRKRSGKTRSLDRYRRTLRLSLAKGCGSLDGETRRGRRRRHPSRSGRTGPSRIRDESSTYVARYRDGMVFEVSTGCRDKSRFP